MHLSRRLFLSAAAAAAALSLPACKEGGKSDGAAAKPRVLIVTNVTADFWKICEAGAMKAGRDFDVDVLFRMPDSIDVGKQKAILDAETKKAIAGVAVSVIDPKEQSADLKLIGAKIPLLAMDNDAPDSGRLGYIGIDNYVGGQAAGKLVMEAMPEGGTVVVHIGAMDSDNARKRFQGVVDALAGQKDAKGPTYGKYELYGNAPITDGGLKENCIPKAKDALKKLADKKVCVVGLYAYNAPAVLVAAASLGVADKIKIVSFDEDEDTLKGIQQGSIVGTVVQDPYQYGYKSVEILAALARGDKSKLPPAPIPIRVVTKEGGPGRMKAAEFSALLAEQLGR